VLLIPPAEGTFYVGDPLQLSFDRPIERDSLVIRVWPGARDVEREMLSDSVPLLEHCTHTSSPCGATALVVHDDRLGATIEFDRETLGKPDVPFILEVLPGVKGDNGAETGRSVWFDFQFKPLPEAPEEAIPFDAGYYIIVAKTDQPPATMSLVTDVMVLADGRVALAGGEADEIGDAPKNTTDPTKLRMDDSPLGYAVFALGRIRLSEEGERFLETDPFAISVTQGPVRVLLEGTRITCKVVVNPETGHDRLDGTLSWEKITLFAGTTDPLEYEYEAGGTTIDAADYVSPDLVPEGAPSVCGDLCGVVTAQCEPPEGFPGEDFCE